MLYSAPDALTQQFVLSCNTSAISPFSIGKMVTISNRRICSRVLQGSQVETMKMGEILSSPHYRLNFNWVHRIQHCMYLFILQV